MVLKSTIMKRMDAPVMANLKVYQLKYFYLINYLINGDLHKKKPQVGPILIALSYVVFLLIFISEERSLWGFSEVFF